MRRPASPARLPITIALALLVPFSAVGAQAGGYRLEYTGYSHGLTVLRLTASLTLTQRGYAAQVAFRLAGLPGMIVHADSDSRAEGSFADGQARPSLFEASGHLRGAARVTRIAYAGGNPVIEALIPPVEQERSAVPEADTSGAIDTLSAAALLIRRVGEAGRCDGVVRTFDGRRLAAQTAHTAGPELLDRTARSIFAGQALRCEIEGRQLAGFTKGDRGDDQRRPRHGTAWLADMLPGAPPVPVRIAFDARLLGAVTLYLTALAPARQPQAFLPADRDHILGVESPER